mgnify:CR=1 FL=1
MARALAIVPQTPVLAEAEKRREEEEYRQRVERQAEMMEEDDILVVEVTVEAVAEAGPHRPLRALVTEVD